VQFFPTPVHSLASHLLALPDLQTDPSRNRGGVHRPVARACGWRLGGPLQAFLDPFDGQWVRSLGGKGQALEGNN